MKAESILLAGDFRPGRLGASYANAFQILGCEVNRFDIVAQRQALGWFARNRIVHRLTIGNLAARRAWSVQFNRNLMDASRRCGAPVVFVHNGDWVMPETVRTLRQEGRRVVIFHADNPLPPHYNHRPETLATAALADLYLVWSERLVERLTCEGVRAHFLAFGWDPEAFPYCGDIPQGSRREVVFIGGWDREREAFLEQLAAHVPLEIHGPGYWGTRTRRGSRVRACWQGSALESPQAATVIRESGVCLNVLRTQHVINGQPDGVIMRHFEVPGAGGFLLSTRSGGATRLFPEGTTADYFSSVEECVEKCLHHLDDATRRVEMAEQAHANIRKHHTYVHRAREILTMLKSLACDAPR